MIARTPIPLYVLVGGRSARFGRPKATEPVDGRALALHVADALGTPGRVTLVGSGAPELDGLGLPCIADPMADQGPLGGLRAALADAGAGWIALAPCDVVGLRAAWLDRLRAATGPGVRAVAFRGERWEPLPSLWHTDALAEVDGALADGSRALHRLLDAVGAVSVALPGDWAAAVRVTTPDDLPAAEQAAWRVRAVALGVHSVAVQRWQPQAPADRLAPGNVFADSVAVEAPLEVRVAWHGDGVQHTAPLTVTMRTPGDDADLVYGLLLGERVVAQPSAIATVRHIDASTAEVTLAPSVVPRMAASARVLPATGACGVCGKASLTAVQASVDGRALQDTTGLEAGRLADLLAQMRAHQHAFDATGGVHAAALFDRDGALLVVREDIGRHNAVDKVVGWAARGGRFPLPGCVLVTSGRAGFEIVQKALAARIPVVVAVGAPSSLAVDLAREGGLTLVAFARGGGFSVYAGGERIGVDP